MKNLSTLGLLLIIVLLGSSCNGDFWGLEDSGIYGAVIDAETGAPIPFALVYINGPETREVEADRNGNYRAEHLRAGNYRVSAEAYRYITPFEDVNIFENQYAIQDIEMQFHSALSTHLLDFGTDLEELTIIVTNIFDRPIDIDTDENHIWLQVDESISGLLPGQSAVMRVEINRMFLDPGVYDVPLIVEVEEDFGFDVFESYVVDIRVEE